jgi:hypothetical protein
VFRLLRHFGLDFAGDSRSLDNVVLETCLRACELYLWVDGRSMRSLGIVHAKKDVESQERK